MNPNSFMGMGICSVGRMPEGSAVSKRDRPKTKTLSHPQIYLKREEGCPTRQMICERNRLLKKRAK